MGLLDWLFKRKNEENEAAYASVVMLLRSPSTLNDEELQAAAARAYKTFEYAGVIAGTRTLLVKTTILSVQSNDGFYFDPERDKAAADTDVFAKAWAEHTAWLAVDLPQTQGKPKAIRIPSYQISLPLIEQLWDENCSGLYLPAEGITAPSTGTYSSSLSWFSKNREFAKALALDSN